MHKRRNTPNQDEYTPTSGHDQIKDSEPSQLRRKIGAIAMGSKLRSRDDKKIKKQVRRQKGDWKYWHVSEGPAARDIWLEEELALRRKR